MLPISASARPMLHLEEVWERRESNLKHSRSELSTTVEDSLSLSDSAMVERIREGDLGVFEGVFRKHYPELVRFAFSIVRSQDVAQDLVSDMFATLFERRSTWEIRTSIRAYLVAATRYRVFNYVRDSGRAQKRYAMLSLALDDDDVTTGPSQESRLIQKEESATQLAALEKAMAELTPRSRMVVALRWRQQLSFNEIAEIMNTTSAAVQMQLSRAMKLLREHIPDYLK